MSHFRQLCFCFLVQQAVLICASCVELTNFAEGLTCILVTGGAFRKQSLNRSSGPRRTGGRACADLRFSRLIETPFRLLLTMSMHFPHTLSRNGLLHTHSASCSVLAASRLQTRQPYLCRRSLRTRCGSFMDLPSDGPCSSSLTE